VLDVSGLSAGYGEIRVLDQISLRVPEGVTCVIGPNGSGKSTLLKSIFGLADKMGGRVHFGDWDISSSSPLAIRRLGIAYVAQGRWNFPHMTVYENLEMGAYARTDDAVRDDIVDMEDRFPILSARRHERAGNLSGGEQQILEMAMGLLSRPTLMLLDEPSVGLAPRMVSEVFRSITEIGRAGVSILMVEQNAKQGLRISRHGVVLDTGRKVLEGTADEILMNEDVKRAYLGERISQ
jgi:branched-chain amino acid transport system ATP-binding protein